MTNKGAVARGKTNRRKGHQFERDIASDFRLLGFPKAKRNLEYREGEGVDLTGTTPFQVQLKCGKKPPSALSILSEIPDKDGTYKLGIVKQDRKEPYVVMRYTDFKEILGMLINEGII